LRGLGSAHHVASAVALRFVGKAMGGGELMRVDVAGVKNFEGHGGPSRPVGALSLSAPAARD